jgi:hypothetical protein
LGSAFTRPSFLRSLTGRGATATSPTATTPNANTTSLGGTQNQAQVPVEMTVTGATSTAQTQEEGLPARPLDVESGAGIGRTGT